MKRLQIVIAVILLAGSGCGLSLSACGTTNPSGSVVSTASFVGTGVSGTASIYRDGDSYVLRLDSVSFPDDGNWVRVTADGGSVSEILRVNCKDGSSNVNVATTGDRTFVAVALLDSNVDATASILATATF